MRETRRGDDRDHDNKKARLTRKSALCKKGDRSSEARPNKSGAHRPFVSLSFPSSSQPARSSPPAARGQRGARTWPPRAPLPGGGGGRGGPAPDKGSGSSEGAGCRRRKLRSPPPPARGRAGGRGSWPAARRSHRGSCAPAFSRIPHRPRRGAHSPDSWWRPQSQRSSETRSEGAKCACAGSASRQRGDSPPPSSPASQLAKPGDGKLAADPSAEVPRAEGQARGRFVLRSLRARRKSERAARRVLLVEAAAAPPDGPSASHRLWVTDTLSEGGAGLGGGA